MFPGTQLPILNLTGVVMSFPRIASKISVHLHTTLTGSNWA